MISEGALDGTLCALSRGMLPPYIIEQLRQREEARKEADARIQLELPVPVPRERPAPEPDAEPRGVVIIEVG